MWAPELKWEYCQMVQKTAFEPPIVTRKANFGDCGQLTLTTNNNIEELSASRPEHFYEDLANSYDHFDTLPEISEYGVLNNSILYSPIPEDYPIVASICGQYSAYISRY